MRIRAAHGMQHGTRTERQMRLACTAIAHGGQQRIEGEAAWFGTATPPRMEARVRAESVVMVLRLFVSIMRFQGQNFTNEFKRESIPSHRPRSPSARLRDGSLFCLERRTARPQGQTTPVDVQKCSAGPASPPRSRSCRKAPLLFCSLVVCYLLRQVLLRQCRDQPANALASGICP